MELTTRCMKFNLTPYLKSFVTIICIAQVHLVRAFCWRRQV